MIATLVLFGATGDLTGRLLLPAIAQLSSDGVLPADFSLIAAADQPWTDARFTDHARARLAEHAGTIAETVRESVLSRLSYRQLDVGDPRQVADLVANLPTPAAIYLALPTDLQLPAAQALAAAALPAGSRVAVEKPFGTDTESAAELNAVLADIGPSDAIVRVDHVLAMAAVQRLVTEQRPWNSDTVSRIDILWEETLALEGRARFYDRAGALRDLVQNHLLQMLCLIAMEPVSDSAAGRAAVLETVCPLTAENIRTRTRRARYTAGRLSDGDRAVPDYTAEPGVDPARGTETYAEVRLTLDTPRWADTTFVLRAAKALGRLRRGVLVHFTDGTERWLDVDTPLDDAQVSAEAGAYVVVLRELLAGRSELSVGAVPSERAWQIFTPVLDAWTAGRVPLLEYPAGSDGPR